MKKPLQDLRNKRNLTQEQASKILGIRKEYLSMIENGTRVVKANEDKSLSEFVFV